MGNIKRKAKFVGDIAMSSITRTIADGPTVSLSAGVGLLQGLKYNGSLKRGFKAGAATMCVMVGIQVVRDVVINWDVIKKL